MKKAGSLLYNGSIMQKTFLTAAWRNLVMANYIIDPLLLQPYLPYKTELDTFNGKHFVSLVGFMFQDVRVMGISFPFHTSFEEINLRFYVRYKQNNEWRRGVVFIKEIVSKRMISFVANNLYGENYVTLQTKHTWSRNNDDLSIGYEWKVGKQWNHINCIASGEPEIIIENSAEEFITEHYWGYTCVNKTCAGVYEVQHPKWNVHKVKSYDIICSAKELYGQAFDETLNQQPESVFLAEGSAIKVLKGERLF